jgi:Carboxypeptidase regulatory-like domain
MVFGGDLMDLFSLQEVHPTSQFTRRDRFWSGFKRNICFPFAVVSLSFAYLATVTFAQTELGAITGTIEDTSGAAIPNCQVEIKSTQTSAVRTATTDQNGFYSVPSLTVGSYTISVSAAGFKRAVTNVVLTTSGTVANLQIPTGNVQQQVVVNAESGSVNLQTDSHELATSVTPAQLVNLPNSGRSIISIATLGPASQPGTDVGVDGGDEGFYGQTAASVIISGLGNAHTAFLQDGVANTNLLTQTANILASVEATQEATTLLNGAPARFSQPAVIDVITKGGSNQVHGTAYDFLQNDVFDATNWFATSKPAKRYNLFGGNLGQRTLQLALRYAF